MSKTRLHITNGDSAADIIKESSIEGDVLPWRDPMHHGPFPSGLALDSVSDLRAEYLAADRLDVDEVKLGFKQRNNRLREASQYDEIVLWFEHDLLDQLQILELLSWFHETDIGSTQLSMICIDRFPGVECFRGIGQLDCEQMATLLPIRRPLSSAQIQFAHITWAAFRSENPARIEELSRTEPSVFPYLNSALSRHLQEYPWISDGLTRTERQILGLVSFGVVKPGAIFVKNMELEQALYIGDWRTYQIIADLCQSRVPLLRCSPHGNFKYPPDGAFTTEMFREQRLSITVEGQQVLTGTHHACSLISRDFWLGGVRFVSGKPMWYWNDDAHKLVFLSTEPI